MFLSHLSIAQYPKRIINKDTVVVLTEPQAKYINKRFNDFVKNDSLNKVSIDSLSKKIKYFDNQESIYSKKISDAYHAVLLIDDENKYLRETNHSLQMAKTATHISVLTLMFTVVMLIKVTSGR